MYYTKALLRVLRNLGVLKGLTQEEKNAFGVYVAGPAMFGSIDTYFFLSRGLRTSRHKFAREGLACLLESCTRGEAAAVIAAVEDATGHPLSSLLRKGSAYDKRVAAVAAMHAGDPDAVAYEDPDNPYASVELVTGEKPESFLHTKQKTGKEKASKIARKTGVGCLMVVYNFLFGVFTLFIWHFWYFSHLAYVAWNT